MSGTTPVAVADELLRYQQARSTLEASRSELEELQTSEAVGVFQKQVALLQKRLLNDPKSLRDIFIADGTSAIVWEFQQAELGQGFTTTLWDLLKRDDDMSVILQRFVWALPLKFKRKFIKAIDVHLRERYPMFKDLSVGWPGETYIPPYIRPAEQRAQDFELVNQGYLGYQSLGYSLRECELFVWLEVLRDKQCDDRPCEVGLLIQGKSEPKGGCPVKIHIPEMLDLLGTGRHREALELIESCNPLPNVTGRVCPQELQCQGVCTHTKRPIEIGQIEWYLPEHDKAVNPGANKRFAGIVSPWAAAAKPPIAVVGSGPAGLINAYLLAAEGFPVTVFEAFHDLGGVLRYGIPEFRLPNSLIDDVVEKITLLGGRFVRNFVVGKTATLEDLKAAGFWKVFLGTGAGLPTFMNVPGEHLLGVMSANEFLTRVNLMRGLDDRYETPLPEVKGKQVFVIGGGNTAMDAARTAKRLGGHVTIVYRRTQKEMPARVEELHHALEEGIALAVLRSPSEFLGDGKTNFVTYAVLDVNELGEPDKSGRRSPKPTGKVERLPVDLVIMALGNTANPIMKDAEPTLKTNKWGTIEIERGSQQTSIPDVYTGGDAARGGSTAIRAAGDGQAAAREIVGEIPFSAAEITAMVAKAARYTELGQLKPTIVDKIELAGGIVEFVVRAPMVAKAARPGQFVRVLPWDKGELIPLTLADWDAEKGTIDLVVQGMGTSSLEINRMAIGDAFSGIAGPLGRASELHRYEGNQTVVFCAGGVGLPPVYPIMRAHLEMGNHVTLISGFRAVDFLFWTGADERVGLLQKQFGDQLDVIYTTNDGSFGVKGFVTGPLEQMMKANQQGEGRAIAEVIAIGPPLMMRAVSDLTKPYGVKTVASLNSIMVDATGMCGACMVPVTIDGKMVRKHACIDGPELDAHSIDWDKFLPRFNHFKAQELESKIKHGFA
ncbi:MULTISPECIES: sulfide/dihydroorotate dehydrogenase-like FAD/NAD-binding protein [Rhodopseudomonas]|uniref:2-polyprenylphenol hydroxylase n=1 Tax=Rhodopseudomonas palustris TaxID=1076 RepID=A0A0D7EEB6_RHOPL|nr:MULTISPECIES: sulfide/dihydroorotate dehydrogenase-like FAD/NAD-binding protein [Rhodopseudomonas]KIZ38976.1 2-polyprenylphenol hydroxylase [Rhodopseudomonas palustris]MDF3809399.1 sulfide/dihydroorotate dehydrogenase-like FAD/NAD-binding protein [Rhodopseudomonas sp. BAL398]WOK16027.1 sulfide/dihydroorotate dehydrogenase-like FAD/NAD-binding protein [Rhodopseudomonas sp. BAL398]